MAAAPLFVSPREPYAVRAELTKQQAMDTITPVTQYIESHLQRIKQNCLSDGDLLNLLGGEGGIQVDVVFYLVSNRTPGLPLTFFLFTLELPLIRRPGLRPVDIHYLRQLAPLTNIILLLCQADLMSPEQVAASKEQIYSQLDEANIRPFSFSVPSPSYLTSSDPERQGVYAISSAAGSDHDTMDASLLMSPDYVQPLIPTELASLVEQVFSSNGVSWLRHAVARKYVQWRNSEGNDHRGHHSPRLKMPAPGYSPSQLMSLAGGHYPTASQVLTPPVGPTGSSYALARLADHTQREERLAQVRLANWAADLQRSLAREREQYAALARGERAIWLTEKINECIQDGSLVPAATPASGQGTGMMGSGFSPFPNRKGYEVAPPSSGSGSGSSSTSPQGGRPGRGQPQRQSRRNSQQRRKHDPLGDPLGLLQVADELRHKGLVALEVLGSLGVLGGVALWVTKHYLHLPASGWLAVEWERFWNGVR